MNDAGVPYNHRKPAMDDSEDDPARAKFLAELAAKKQRPQSNWREILSTPMEHQSWMPREKSRRRA